MVDWGLRADNHSSFSFSLWLHRLFLFPTEMMQNSATTSSLHLPLSTYKHRHCVSYSSAHTTCARTEHNMPTPILPHRVRTNPIAEPCLKLGQSGLHPQTRRATPKPSNCHGQDHCSQLQQPLHQPFGAGTLPKHANRSLKPMEFIPSTELHHA